MLEVDKLALWLPMTMPHARTHYYRSGAGAFSVRPVLMRQYNRYAKGVEFVERWALFNGKHMVHELLPVSDRDVCLEQAEAWLEESGLV